MKDDKTLDILMSIIDDAFDKHYNKEEKMETQPELAPQQEQPMTAMYESIEDYTTKTGKRFRMTKRQKELGMTREESFKLTYGGTN